MHSKRFSFCIALFLVAGLIVLGLPSEGWTGLTGKIRGVITDTNGDSLPGAHPHRVSRRGGAEPQRLA